MIDFLVSKDLVPYEDALLEMDSRVKAIHEGTANEAIWLLEHPPIYTAGTSANEIDLRNPQFPVYATGRGGQYTYHGPGQRIAYVMLDLKKRQKHPDVKRFVCNLEAWIIKALADFGVKGERREGRIGIWVNSDTGESKIAAIGVRVRHWITLHGVSINVNPDLSHFEGIIPCGISEHGVTSLKALGKQASMKNLDEKLEFHKDVLLDF